MVSGLPDSLLWRLYRTLEETLLRRDRFCIDINSPRTLQTVTEKLFQAVSRYANDVIWSSLLRFEHLLIPSPGAYSPRCD